MRLAFVANTFALTGAVSLIALAVLPFSVEFALRLAAACAGVTLLSAFITPALRGVWPGDRVQVVTTSNGGLLSAIWSKGAIALENARQNGRIRVRLDDGSELLAVVDSYDGWFSPAKVRASPPSEKEIKVY